MKVKEINIKFMNIKKNVIYLIYLVKNLLINIEELIRMKRLRVRVWQL